VLALLFDSCALHHGGLLHTGLGHILIRLVIASTATALGPTGADFEVVMRAPGGYAAAVCEKDDLSARIKGRDAQGQQLRQS